MVRKARHEIADYDTVMSPVDTGTPHNAVGIVQIIRQVFEARIMKFVCGNAASYGALSC